MCLYNWVDPPFSLHAGVIRLERELYLWLAILACALLGFAEDLKPDFLTPVLRLAAKFAVLGSLLWAWPELVPAKLGVVGVDALLQFPLLAWALTTVFCVGFINAFNMADGANGLVPGISAVVCTIFFMEYGRPADGILMFICTMFLIFNVISGWFFLGDTGSYGLGSYYFGLWSQWRSGRKFFHMIFGGLACLSLF